MDYLGMLTGEQRLAISEDFDYIRATANFVGLRLFPVVRTENLKLAVMNLLDGNDVPVMALVHALDTEARIGDRPDFTEINYELLLVKEKLNQGEALRKKLKDAGMTNDEATLIRQIYNDASNLIQKVLTRFEASALELLCTGKNVIKENNVDIVIDHKIPEKNMLVVSGWSSANADILGDLMKIQKNAKNKIVRAYTSDKIMGYILNNAKLTSIASDLKEYLTEDFAKTYIKSKFGVEFVVIDETYKLSHHDDVEKNMFDEDTVTFAITAGTLGNTFVTSTPAEDVAMANITERRGFVVVDQWLGNDPKTVWTEASGMGLPVLKNNKLIYICKVGA